MTELEKRFHYEMVEIFKAAKTECKYNASRFIQLVSDAGGLAAAKKLISTDGGKDGFIALWKHGRLDLSIEAHIIKPEYFELFTDEERAICKKRLTEYDYFKESNLFI